MTDNYSAVREAIEKEFIETITPLVAVTYGLQLVEVTKISTNTILTFVNEAKVKHYCVISTEIIFINQDIAVEDVFNQIDTQRKYLS